ncbi:MAG: hypothetical protein ACRES7_09415 [Gammaproteobacteria bacterium]
MEPKGITQEESFIWIGKIMLAANMADFALYIAFTLLSGTTPPITRAIYYSLDAISAKEKITRKVAQAQKLSEDKQACIEDIICETRKANNQRNEFAHAIIANDTETGALRRTRFKLADWEAGTEFLTREYLSEKLTLAQTASNKAMDHLIRLIGLLQGQPLSTNAAPADAAASQEEARRHNDLAQSLVEPYRYPAGPPQK